MMVAMSGVPCLTCCHSTKLRTTTGSLHHVVASNGLSEVSAYDEPT